MSTDLALLSFFVRLLAAVFLFSLRSGNILSNRLLATYLAITALDISNFIFIDFYGGHLNLDMLRANLAAFEGPLLYLYVKSVLYDDFRLSRSHLLHIIPYVVVVSAFVPRFYLASDSGKALFYNNQNPIFEVVFIHLFMYLVMALYLFLIFKLLHQNKITVLRAFSDDSHLNKRWLHNFMSVFLIAFAITAVRNVVKFTEYSQAISVMTDVMMAATLTFVCWILWQVVHRPEIFKGVDSKLEDIVSGPKLKKVDQRQAESTISQLGDYMAKERPYLQSTLNIERLAELVGVEAQEISKSLNHHLGIHFFDYVNGYRIEEACQQLSSKALSDKTILDILYDSGFNSKSSFNTAFKKNKNMTPSQFRNQFI